MKTYLNNVEFEASNVAPIYHNQDLSIIVCLYSDSIATVMEAAGTETDIIIGDMFSGTGYKAESVSQYYEPLEDMTVTAYQIRFVPKSVMATVRFIQEDVEILSGAIEELAEIIGGSE